jgi:hypothetical protein
MKDNEFSRHPQLEVVLVVEWNLLRLARRSSRNFLLKIKKRELLGKSQLSKLKWKYGRGI